MGTSEATHVSFDAAYPEDRREDGGPPGGDLADAVRRGLEAIGVTCGPIDESDYAYAFEVAKGNERGVAMVG